MQGTLGDLWIFNTDESTWIAPVFEGCPPCPREMHTGTMISDGRMLVCGGRSPQGQASPLPTPGSTAAASCITSCIRPPCKCCNLHWLFFGLPVRWLQVIAVSVWVQVLCDLSIFDGDEMKWSSPVPTPFFLCAHSASSMLFPAQSTAQAALGKEIVVATYIALFRLPASTSLVCFISPL
jgi:hypothetical protein